MRFRRESDNTLRRASKYLAIPFIVLSLITLWQSLAAMGVFSWCVPILISKLDEVVYFAIMRIAVCRMGIVLSIVELCMGILYILEGRGLVGRRKQEPKSLSPESSVFKSDIVSNNETKVNADDNKSEEDGTGSESASCTEGVLSSEPNIATSAGNLVRTEVELSEFMLSNKSKTSYHVMLVVFIALNIITFM